MTVNLLPQNIEAYASLHTTPELPPLPALTRETHIKTAMGVMLSGHLQGTFLQMITQMIRPKQVLEIGTFTGYSAICFARGLEPGSILHTIELDEELFDIAHKYFVQAGLSDKIIQHTGKASDIIPMLNGPFDLVFIDADKPNYTFYYDLLFDKVSQGGYIIADNVLYEGEACLPADQQSKNARAMHAFNTMIKEDQRVEHILLPLRDGLMIIRKK